MAATALELLDTEDELIEETTEDVDDSNEDWALDIDEEELITPGTDEEALLPGTDCCELLCDDG